MSNEERAITAATEAALSPAHPASALDDAFLESQTPATRIAYRNGLNAFARHLGEPSARDAVLRLVRDGQGIANATVLAYRSALQREGLAPATINRRLSAVKSCVALARMLGIVPWKIEVRGIKVAPYRDTRGPGAAGAAALMRAATRTRDAALLHLLHDVALRRREVTQLDLADYDREGKRLRILGKGRTQHEWITLPDETCASLDAWVSERGDRAGPLFVSIDRAHPGHRLTPTSVYRIVRALGDDIGIRARPHGLRHSAITSALDITNGDVRAVAKFSRHADPKVLTDYYDDARRDLGGEIARKLAAAMSSV